MQDDPQEKDGKKTYKFYQKVPIQSYLIAIAAGRLESRRIGPRSHVWSEIEYGMLAFLFWKNSVGIIIRARYSMKCIY